MSSVIGHQLLTPAELEALHPLASDSALFIFKSRQTAAEILAGKEPRTALLVGPCSIHDPAQALDYADKIRSLQRRIDPQFFLVMRVFLEKPRTRLGWKGLLYDPYLNG